jgi:hypothetical protein
MTSRSVTGTVNGVPGSLTWNLAGTNLTGEFDATAAIQSGPWGLSNLRGRLNEIGTVPGPPGPLGTYTGQVHSAP